MMFFSISRQGASPPSSVLSFLVACFLWIQLAESAAVGFSNKGLRAPARERLSINKGWTFARFIDNPDSLSYDILKPWMLASSTKFTTSATKPTIPSTTPAAVNAQYAQASFDDSAWEAVNVPHDWAIYGPFNAPGVSGGMGRLPSNGVGWYRRNLTFTADDKGKSIFLDIDGAMSYAAVWLNGKIVGGWPFGYASFRLDLTPYIEIGSDNILAVRVDNALQNSRWYPGAGIYRNVWLVKTATTHVDQYGTHITTPSVSADAATADLVVTVENTGTTAQTVDVVTEVFPYDRRTRSASRDLKATFPRASVSVAAGSTASVNGSATVFNPQLWGPLPEQTPNLYVAVTTVSIKGKAIDTYETKFGFRTIVYDADKGIFVNGQHVRIQGTNNHHDLGALGGAFNLRAATRQLEMLQELGCNALRTSHNPPAPELIDLADEMGYLVVDEIFDVWNNYKRINDFHIIFADWHEADLRSFVRRDRNNPSVIVWSYGNEISEQRSNTSGPLSQELHDIIHQEDPTRQTTASMHVGTAGSPFADVMDIESLNYQGEGLGDAAPTFPSFRSAYPNKVIWTTESASTVSTRGTYIFPVASGNTATFNSTSGSDDLNMYVSAYELYEPGWGGSPDKVFAAQDAHPYVAGEFVWTGWDYLGEPTPYDNSRSSYFGIIDLAGFKKDRWYLYQARWRSDLPMAHILPHWTWPDRTGLVTPVHVFTSADEAELFVNGKSAGRLQGSPSVYRYRWDNVTYSPGELHVVTYKNGKKWATDTVKTAGAPARLVLTADRRVIHGDGDDLSFVSVAVVDAKGNTVPEANNAITFSATGAGEIVATDNGDPTDMTVFQDPTRKAFSGLALAIVRAKVPAKRGQTVEVTASAAGLISGKVTLTLL